MASWGWQEIQKLAQVKDTAEYFISWFRNLMHTSTKVENQMIYEKWGRKLDSVLVDLVHSLVYFGRELSPEHQHLLFQVIDLLHNQDQPLNGQK